MFCNKCGSQLPDGSQFCIRCGAPIGAAKSAPATIVGSAAPSGLRRANAKVVAFAAGACVLAAVAVFVVWLLFFSPYEIDETRFPDAALRGIVSAQFDPDGDGKLTRDEASAVESLSVDGASDLTGLDTFANLRELILSGDALQTADLSSCSSLETLEAYGCPNLSTLMLPDSSSLRTLEVQDTQLASLDLACAPLLETLDVTNCPVSELAVGQCASLAALSACGSGLSSLDLASNAALADLKVDDAVLLVNLEATPLHEVWVVDSLTHTVPSVNAVEGYTVSAQGAYDENGRLVEISGYGYDQEFGYSYAYDEAGRCIAMDDAGTNGSPAVHWDIAYDEAGRIQRATSDWGDVWEYTYGEGSAPVSCMVAVGQGGTSNVQYAYSEQGLLSSYAVAYGVGGMGSVRNLSYDAENRVAAVSDGSGSTSETGNYLLARNNEGKITEVSFDWGTFGSYRQTYAYNSDGTFSDAARDVKASSANMSRSYMTVSKTAFKYDESHRLQSWEPTYVDSYGNKEVNGSNAVTYKRFITADVDFEPQSFIDLGDILSPSYEAHFWNPAEVLMEAGEVAFNGVPRLFCSGSVSPAYGEGGSVSDIQDDQAMAAPEAGASAPSTSSAGAADSSVSEPLSFSGVKVAEASSSLPTDNVNTSGYDPSRILDGDTSTAWVEGTDGPGVREWIALSGDEDQGFSGLTIWNGYQKSQEIYEANARPSNISIYIDDENIGLFDLEDSGSGPQKIDFGGVYEGKVLKIVIDGVYPGTKYEDCAISEIEVY